VARESAALLLEAMGPERLVWGSDWPHTQNEAIRFADTVHNLIDWVPDPDDRRIILQDSPLRLFRFNQAIGG